VRITCSNCGAHENIGPSKITDAVLRGWGSYGSALYCPECTKTWDERNKGRPMASALHTTQRLYELIAPRNGRYR
jgi:hypothetical protein